MKEKNRLVMDAHASLEPHILTAADTLEERLGYKLRNRGLFLSALTHSSGAEHRLASNERMEFLGDSILGVVVCELLYQQYPAYLEGDLTFIKSIVITRPDLREGQPGIGNAGIPDLRAKG